ncbi:hypothetical protein [Brevibacillus laterosporus]|uniref:hypothetical protein n=1 Tax=Brevibacillus laterosporus TaxID=1465 RepID=UPI000CE398B4|nr:hypothetical protein [Brevibacillus laterosporus]MBG9799122.1 hypothetical protein [Brevibacillus laterosporus]MED1911875.1 hypothetical protein [Brevibacillus laterosporus]PPA86046.1 hypothetical protein C4A75_05415 [Brevibacillus laterosporus]
MGWNVINKEKVKGSADETKNISKFIKEIAEQTNLLGLNVAIEGGFSDCLAFNNWYTSQLLNAKQ